jgi:Zn-dependent peptidase ImmA (M78 family)
MTTRQAMLHGAKAAESLHRKLGTQQKLAAFGSSVDVFAVIADLDVPMLFRPLDKLLGAYLPDPGIVVTTKRPITIQRFTGAHELGHFWCKHTARSFDDESIISGSPFLARDRAMEVEANSFAAHFLMPNWLARPLLQEVANTTALDAPAVIYQTSLRLGCSYEATWRTLLQHRLITPPAAAECERTSPKSIKERLVPGLEVRSWRDTDIWLLDEKDEGREIYAEPDDVFVIRLHQHSSGGYLWDTEKLRQSGFAILKDSNGPIARQRNLDKPGEKGADMFVGNTTREFWLSMPSAAEKKKAAVEMRRPWEAAGDSKKTFAIYYSVSGPEPSGYSRAERQRRGYSEAAH